MNGSGVCKVFQAGQRKQAGMAGARDHKGFRCLRLDEPLGAGWGGGCALPVCLRLAPEAGGCEFCGSEGSGKIPWGSGQPSESSGAFLLCVNCRGEVGMALGHPRVVS